MEIIIDTREKEGKWFFSNTEMITRKLDCGDYTLVGFESEICIERKKTTTELAINLGSDFGRFGRELELMKSFPFAYIICEFSFDELLNFPNKTKISPKIKSSIRMNGKYMVKLLSSFKEKYGVDIIYAGNRETAILEAEKIFEYVQEIR